MGNCMSNVNEEKLNQSALSLGKFHEQQLHKPYSTSNNRENEGLCDRCTDMRRKGPCTCIKYGTCGCTPNAAPSSSCVFYSKRIQDLLEVRRTEFETAKEHWTEVDPTSQAELESMAEKNRKYFDEVLVNHPEWGAFFKKFEDVEVGAKSGEGGQAEIFDASSRLKADQFPSIVAKVFKKDYPLEALQEQWPPQMLSLSA